MLLRETVKERQRSRVGRLCPHPYPKGPKTPRLCVCVRSHQWATTLGDLTSEKRRLQVWGAGADRLWAPSTLTALGADPA